MADFLLSVSVELLAAAVIFALGFVFSRIPRTLERHRFRNFFGRSISEGDFKVVYGMITQSSSEGAAEEIAEHKFKKVFHNGRIIEQMTTRQVVTPALVRSLSYIVQEMTKYVGKPILVCTDEEAIPNLDTAFISLGGAAVNEITDWALNEESNTLFRFSYPRYSVWKLHVVSPQGQVTFAHPKGHGIDYGLILKVRNSRFPKHFFFVCAGIGSWGASGAAWYLSNHWKAIYKEFKSNEFGLVIEVRRGSDSSATTVFP